MTSFWLDVFRVRDLYMYSKTCQSESSIYRIWRRSEMIFFGYEICACTRKPANQIHIFIGNDIILIGCFLSTSFVCTRNSANQNHVFIRYSSSFWLDVFRVRDLYIYSKSGQSEACIYRIWRRSEWMFSITPKFYFCKTDFRYPNQRTRRSDVDSGVCSLVTL